MLNPEQKSVLIIGGLGFAGILFSLYNILDLNAKFENSKTKTVYSTKDLNKDGRDDLISESIKGYKTPLFAHVKEDGNITYLSGEQMKKIDSTTDYQTIEDMLNKK